ncbi:MAG: response regulator [bacterium]|nr:response regulator [bacterium]
MVRKTILLVEDDAVTVKLMVRALEPIGVQVTVCRDGKEALEAFAAAAPDLVITDAMLPGMDGFSLAGKIREQQTGKTVPIIMTTAVFRKDVYRDEADRIGINHFMPKPFDPDELRQKVTEMLGQKP